MCQPTSSSEPVIGSQRSRGTKKQVPCESDYDILEDVTLPGKVGWWRPLHPLFIVAMLPFLPSWFFLNRGFTQWFHWGIIFYMISGQKDYWRRFLVIHGGGVVAGWYAAVVHEILYYGRFCHLLYNNMPLGMRSLMFANGELAKGGIITDTAPALATLAASHLIDLLAHPLLVYMMWKMHTSRGGTLRTLVTWDLVIGTYLWSRVYSMTHLYYNNGVIDGLFYYGHDVYKIDNMESYMVAYVGEAIYWAGLVAYKLYFQAGQDLELKIRIGNNRRRSSSRKSLTPKQLAKLSIEDKQKPHLIQSESCFSTTSLPFEED